MTEPWRSGAARRGAETRKRTAAARGVAPHCAWAGCEEPRAQGSYCNEHWAQYMRDYRRRLRKSDGGERKLEDVDGRKFSRESESEEVTMSNVEAEARNGASSLQFLPADEADHLEMPSDCQDVAENRTTEPAVVDQRALSSAQYLAWLALQLHEALQAAVECAAGGTPAALEDSEEPRVRPLPSDLPPLERRLLELKMRLDRNNLELARILARRAYASREAFDVGLRTGAPAS